MKKHGWTMAIVALAATLAWTMIAQAALTAARDTPMRTGVDVSVGVASNTTIWAGAMLAVNSGGYAVPASDTAGLRVLGRAATTVVNAGANGAETVSVRRGVFRWVNGDTFTRADVGALAFVEDDATVQKAASATHDIIAGLIVDVDADGVWVDTYSLPSSGSASVVNLAASGNAAITGNATVGGTLGVTGNATLGGTAAVTGNTTVGGTLGVTGNTTVSNITATGTAAVTGNATVGGTLTTTGATTLTGDTTIGASKVVITAASGNILSKGTLGAGANGTEFTVDASGNIGGAAITGSGLVKGGTLGIGSGYLARAGDALVWIEGGVTNSVVADVTN
jgi:hypothetical protein